MPLWRRTATSGLFVLAAAAAAIPQHSLSAQGGEKWPADSSGPVALKFKGVTLTFGGFFAAEAVWRQKNMTGDIGSSYNTLPFTGTTQSYMSEWRGSARQSRISMLAVGNAGDVRLSGYYETDFLGVGVTSNSNESNSYVLRMRQFWGQVNTANGWNFAAGQMWSLLTTDRVGMSPRSEWIPLTIEAQYVPGFNWARQFELRVWKNLGTKAAFGLALDESQTTFAARNPPPNFVLGQPGGSLLNTTNYSTDLAPDLVAKVALDPMPGQHYEIKAIGRVFRDRIVVQPNDSGLTRNHQVYGGGLGAAAVWSVYKDEDGHKRDVFDLGFSGLWGSGVGRYASSQLPDATVRPNGAIVPILGASALAGFEAHPNRKLDLYFYAGVDYDDRTAFYSSSVPPKGVGYGSPLNVIGGCATEYNPGAGGFAPGAAPAAVCSPDTRAIWQMGGGFWYRFLQGSFGTFVWGLQYTYTNRAIWSGTTAVPPVAPVSNLQAINPMAFTSFRYILP